MCCHDNVVGILLPYYLLSILLFMSYILHTSSLYEETFFGFLFLRNIIHLYLPYYQVQE